MHAFRATRAAALVLALSTVARAEPLPVQTVAFEAKSVGRTMKYNIVLPERYEERTDRFPVLYLLHGLTSNYTAWARMRVPEYARPLDVIVVMPDVGNSWYVNWAETDDSEHPARWEDFLIQDLIGHVDSTYRTIPRREGRAINGLSMGGYGALTLGLRHPDLFGSVGSHSGAVAFTRRIGQLLRDGKELPKPAREPSKDPNPAIGIEGFSSPYDRTPRGKIFANADECDAHDPFHLVLQVPREKLPHLYVDCGTDDRLIESNQEFAKLLLDKKIPFTYAQSAGAHAPAYWSREVGHSMAVQVHILRRLLADADRPG